jgi:hypothetical protein
VREPAENPYAPPDSVRNAGSPSRRIAWKLYLWAMLALLLLTFAIFGVRWIQILDLLDLAVFGVGMLGLFAFCYRRRIGTRRFWKVWLPSEVLWDLAILFVFEPLGLAYAIPGEPSSITDSLIGLGGALPLYVGLYLYGHRSPEVWA